MEWKLFDDSSYVSTADFHKDREAVAHIEQPAHIPRMEKTVEIVNHMFDEGLINSATDLGAGDGGMLALINRPDVTWGYDFQPANIVKAAERGVNVMYANFVDDDVRIGDLAICTEVIEHLEDPHGFLARLAPQVRWLVCSSPQNETIDWHAAEHAWAWDKEGYVTMLTNAGFYVSNSFDVIPFQVHLCESEVYGG